MTPTDKADEQQQASQDDEQTMIRENVTWSRAASKKLREIAAQRFPGRARMAGVTLEQVVNEAYERMQSERKRS
jgi:hypothetical protein